MLLWIKEIGKEKSMNYQVLKMSTYAQDILAENNQGIVHSVYRNTINVSIHNHLLAIQTKNSPLSPISLITDLDTEAFSQLPYTVGDYIVIENNADTQIINLSPTMLFPKQHCQELFMNIRRSLITSHTQGFDLIFQFSDLINDNLILAAAQNKIESAYHFYQKKDYENTARELSRLIGLGLGLTPSGDDFLCGMLAGFHLLDRNKHTFTQCLRHYIKENLKNTNEISQAFLKCALHNHYSFAVNKLWSNPSHEQISQMFLQIGHSSGMDTLCGIYFSFLLCKY